MTHPQPDAFQANVARLALLAARAHGFALAGGHALIAHGVISRPTDDVDLFTDKTGGVKAAAHLVADMLRRAGLEVSTIEDDSELGEVFYGLDDDLAEFEVRDGDQVVRLQLCRFDRGRSPVTLDIGPVLHLDDVIATKVAALATRAYPRDFIDVAAALDRYTRAELIALALTADPALSDEEFAEATQRLDQLDDVVFGKYLTSQAQIDRVRARFASWPR